MAQNPSSFPPPLTPQSSEPASPLVNLNLLIDAVTDYGIFMLDITGHVSTWSRGAERLKGYRADEIIGKHFSAFYPPEDAAAGKPATALHVAATQGRFEEEGWRV